MEEHTGSLPGDSHCVGSGQQTPYPLASPPAWLHLLWEAFMVGAVAQPSSGGTHFYFMHL